MRGSNINKQFPWYDSSWLASYAAVKLFLQNNNSNKYEEFIHAMDVLRTPLSFRTIEVDNLFDNETLDIMRDVIDQLTQSQLKKHELLNFGRFVVHNHEWFSSLQHSIADVVSEAVKEPVEPSYNFLSLYNNLGICDVHLDAPSAKWTLDFCIDQSASWPILFSQTKAWPEEGICGGQGWQEQIKNDPSNHFESFVLKPGKAVVFSGSSQWHYRNRMEQQFANNYCHLLFLHFIPKGSRDLTKPEKWPQIFDIEELSEIIIKPNHQNSMPKSVLEWGQCK